MIDPSDLSVSEIRARLAHERDTRALRLWSERLESDPRRGARALGARVRRRRDAIRADRARVNRLFALRRRLRREGARLVAGVDEVGVGPLAGPVVAAAVVLFDRVELPGLNDSKQITRAARERLAEQIRGQAVAVGIGEVTPAEIDRLNILRATLEAMRRAVAALGARPDHVLVDARTIPNLDVAQTALVGGDAEDGSIAAASIVAKVYRDEIMRRLDERYPGYGLAVHKGYPTQRHIEAVRRLGASPVHRRSFAPVANVVAL